MKHSQIIFVKSGRLEKYAKAQPISISDMLSDMERNIGVQLDLMDTKTDKIFGPQKIFDKNVADQRRHWSTRLFWLAVFIISFTCCLLMVHKTYKKWQSSPIIISFDEKMTPISEIPFPAVTICPEMRIGDVDFDIEGMERKLKELKNEKSEKKISNVLTAEEQRAYEAILHVCSYNYTTLSRTFDNILDGLEILPTLAQIEASQNNVYECNYNYNTGKRARAWKCMSKTLHRVGIGICRTFNRLNSKEFFNHENIGEEHFYKHDEYGYDITRNSSWTLEKGFWNSSKSYPIHLSERYESVEHFRVRISRSVKTFTKICNGAYKGYRVYLHAPDEVTTKNYFRVNMGNEVLVKVIPKMSIISESLKTFNIDYRKCYLSGERKLQYFKYYSQNNCRIECVTNFTFNECGCVKFNMLRDPTMRICQQKDIKCYKKVDKIFTAGGKLDPINEAKRNCHCWPSCTTLTYDYEVFTGEYDGDEEEINDDDEKIVIEKAVIRMNFKETEFLKIKKIEIYDSLDFLANCGGLFGLFMGFSILSMLKSVCDIFYKCFTKLMPKIKQMMKI